MIAMVCFQNPALRLADRPPGTAPLRFLASAQAVGTGFADDQDPDPHGRCDPRSAGPGTTGVVLTGLGLWERDLGEEG